jgi:hypothetical protein
VSYFIELLARRRRQNVRFWHKAAISGVSSNVRFPGVKRTFIQLTSMSAFDPKRTSGRRPLHAHSFQSRKMPSKRAPRGALDRRGD